MSDEGGAPQYWPSLARPSRATALGRGTYGVPQVRQLVETQFQMAYPHRVWVTGRVGEPVLSTEGGVRFPLLSSSAPEDFTLACLVPAGTVTALRDLLGGAQDADLEDVLRPGRLARVGGLLRFEAERGSLALVVSELDSTPTALGLADERELVLEEVAARGLRESQQAGGCRLAPIRVALVGDDRGVAVARAEERLARSPYRLHLELRPFGPGSADAPRAIANAVGAAGLDSDLVLLVRDEGRPLRLSAYDAMEAAQAVADSPVPVVTGLGGRGTRTACDEVAFATLPTADAAAEWLLHRLGKAERCLRELAVEVGREVDEGFARARRQLEEARAEVASAADEAAARAEAARRTRSAVLHGGCALFAALVVAAWLLSGDPLVLVGLLLPGALLVLDRVWSSRARTTGSRQMSQRNDDFAKVLDRLRGVRQELARTSNPNKVAGLRDLAQQLVRRGEELLGLLERPAAPAPAPPTAADQGAASLQRPGVVPDASTTRGSVTVVDGGARTS